MQRYLNHLQITFFPILKKAFTTPVSPSTNNDSSDDSSDGSSSSDSDVSNDSVGRFPVPTVDSIKKLLYQNQIGYKVVNGKVYVRMLYRIPALLFPKETFAANLIHDKEMRESVNHVFCCVLYRE